MQADKNKYLILRIRRKTEVGLDHLLTIFKSAIKEAIHLRRTLVIEKYAMRTQHNLGYALNNLDIERYIDLDKTQIYRVKANGSIEQINNAFHYIYAENFNLDEYSTERVLQLQVQPFSEEQNNQYDVIVRSTDDYKYISFYPNILVALYPSDEVVRLTDVVFRAMGTSLSDVKKRSAVYRDVDFSANRDIYQQNMLDNPSYYACLHVRGNDMLQFEHYLYASNPKRLKSIAKEMIPKGTRLYLMSDIKDPGYFDFLMEYYIVYRYYDFPELNALISGDSGSQVDNAMLYSVEKNIFQYAYIKLIRSNRKPKLIYTNSSFEISLRYRLQRVYKYLVNVNVFRESPSTVFNDIKHILRVTRSHDW